MLQKRDSHLIAFKSGGKNSQIKFIHTRKRDITKCKECKVILGETLTIQQRLLILDEKCREIVRKKATCK